MKSKEKHIQKSQGAKVPISSCFSGGKLIFMDNVTERGFNLGKGQKMTVIVVPESGWQGRPKLTFQLGGEGAELNLIMLFVGKNNINFPFDVLIDHKAAYTKASVLLKSALFDCSKLDFSGNLLIEKQAGGTDTYLASHSLILGDEARAKAIPALEIKADEVKAGHAATIGKIDQETIYYFMSRGLDETEAKKIFIEAFFESALHAISDEKIRLLIRQKIINLLP